MEADIKLTDTLFVTVFEIEHGLFQATYRTHENMAAARRLPPYQVGSCVADAKARIAMSAQASGYETIVWDDLQPLRDALRVEKSITAEHVSS